MPSKSRSKSNEDILREFLDTGFSADMPKPKSAMQMARDARLYAAAPDMRDALERVLEAYNQGPDPRKVRDAMDGAIDYVREALDKARLKVKPEVEPERCLQCHRLMTEATEGDSGNGSKVCGQCLDMGMGLDKEV